MKYIYLPIILLILSGCFEEDENILYNPKPTDVQGIWESLSLYQIYPFSALKIDNDGSGKIVLVNRDKKTAVGDIVKFETKENSFLVTIAEPEDLDNTEIWIGSIRRGQMCFESANEDGTKNKDEPIMACYTKANEVSAYREAAYKVLEIE